MAFVKMLWASGSPIPLLGSWDYWTSVVGRIFNFQSITIQKVYPIIAYYAIVHSNNSYTTIMISTEQNAVVYKDGWENRFYSRGTITDTNNITWYWSGFERGGQPIDMSLVLNDTEYEWSLAGGAQAAQDLLDRIYAVPFREDYQNTYYILNKTDVRRTLRKVYGLTLAFIGTGYSLPNVQYISDNADSIINDILTKIGNNTDVHIWMYSKYDNPSRGIYINVYYGTNSDVNAWVDVPKESFYGLEYYSIGTVSTLSDLYSIYVNNGTPTVTESSGAFSIPIMGIAARGLYDLVITNYGADY